MFSLKPSTSQGMKQTLIRSLLFFALAAPLAAEAKVYSKVFPNDYNRVWKGLLIALAKYPLDKNDQESGEIKTSILKPGQAFQSDLTEPKAREHYQISIEVLKTVYRGRRVIKVNIEKDAFSKGDFMNAEQSLKSDGIEEKVLLYRAAREFKIDKTIEQLFDQ
jgi:thiol:disulfide interchange protein